MIQQRRIQIGVVSVSLAVAVFGMYYLSAVFNPFLLALALAYILNPAVRAMERRRVPRKVGIAIIFLAMFMAILVVLLVVIPRVYGEAVSWGIEVAGEPFEDVNNNGRYDEVSERDTWDDLNGNRIYDPAEQYEDLNGNGRYDAVAEKDTWQDSNGNGRYDIGEPYQDLNGNGKFDRDLPADVLHDANGNGKLDPGEPYSDLNHNGKFDADIPADSWSVLTDDRNGNGRFDPGYAYRFIRWFKARAEKDAATSGLLARFADPEEVDRMINRAIASAKANISIIFSTIGTVVAKAWAGGLRGVSWLWRVGLLILLTPIYLAFLLNSLDAGWNMFVRYVPGRIRPKLLEIMRKIDLVISAFFRGRLLVCMAIGIFTAVGFAICGVRFGVLFGLAIGVLSFIPFLNVLGFIPALLSCWMDGFGLGGYLAVVIVYSVGQGIDPLLTSLILGKDLELHPVTILLSLFVCSALLGFFGMLLAVPMVASAKILAREFLLPSLEALAREDPSDCIDPCTPVQPK